MALFLSLWFILLWGGVMIARLLARDLGRKGPTLLNYWRQLCLTKHIHLTLNFA